MFVLYRRSLLPRLLGWEAASERFYDSLDNNEAIPAGRGQQPSSPFAVPVQPFSLDAAMYHALVTLILEAPVPLPHLYSVSLILPGGGPDGWTEG